MEWLLLILLVVSNVFWYVLTKNSTKIIHAKSLANKKVINIQVTQYEDTFMFHDLISGLFIMQDKDYVAAVAKIRELFKGSIVIISVLSEKFNAESI
jgi:uncharacterized protein (UPF0333 family)